MKFKRFFLQIALVKISYTLPFLLGIPVKASPVNN